MEGREETCRSIIDVLSSRIQEDSERAGSNYLPAVASFMCSHYHDTDTHVITRVYLRKSENIPGEKREAGGQSPSYSEGLFRGRLINWQTVNYRAGKSL